MKRYKQLFEQSEFVYEVRGDFDCSYCDNLTSLDGAPQKVGRYFDCSDCGKQFTEEEVREVCDVGDKVFVRKGEVS